MSFKIFTAHVIENEVREMIIALKKNSSHYAVSDLPKQVIKEYARKYGYKVSTKTIGYHEVKVMLVDDPVTKALNPKQGDKPM